MLYLVGPEYFKKWYLEHKSSSNLQSKNWRKNNRLRSNEIKRLATRRLRYNALYHYSNGDVKCACCGERHIEFLTIDHINGGGTKHRKEIGKNGSSLYQWLKNNNYPEGFRVLCFNCNCSYGMLKYCPHKENNQ